MDNIQKGYKIMNEGICKSCGKEDELILGVCEDCFLKNRDKIYPEEAE